MLYRDGYLALDVANSMTAVAAIAEWLDVARIAEQCANGLWVFRGESTAGRDLQAKAGRVGTYSGAARKRAYSLSDEQKALETFKRQARPHLNHTPQSDAEWLAIAQHHGMSTRLLDWTESVLVATYFAVCKAGTKGDAVVYGLEGVDAMTLKDEKRPFKIKSTKLYRPPHISPRIPAQRSVFTVHPDPTAPFAPGGMIEWRISRDACGRIKTVLDACAINEASLFPDLDGLSRHIGWRYKWAKP